MVRKHENVVVVGRVFAPPTLPGVVGPVAADGAEHIAAEDVGADVLVAASEEVVIDSRDHTTGIQAEHLMAELRPEDPFVEKRAANAERILQVLVWPGDISVEGDRKVVDTEFRHEWILPLTGAFPARGTKSQHDND
jgi:hypothetical protein